MNKLSYFLIVMALLCCVVYAQAAGIVRSLPHGTCITMDVVEIEASGSTRIYPHWPRTQLLIEQADGVSEKFRAIVATSTMDTDLPLRDSYSVDIKGSAVFAIQTATDTAKFVITQIKN